MGADGQRKLVIDRCYNFETWKAVNGYRDGSSNDYGQSGCCVVIEGVDRSRWVTFTTISAPLKVGTAMAAEVAGVCLLMGILDLSSTNACVFRVPSTESSTNNDVAFVNWYLQECECHRKRAGL